VPDEISPISSGRLRRFPTEARLAGRPAVEEDDQPARARQRNGIEPLAAAVVALALADLHSADERIRASARAFFSAPSSASESSSLWLWCSALGLDAEAVESAVRRRMDMTADGRSGMRAVVGPAERRARREWLGRQPDAWVAGAI
jgi:hypothetical protein